MARSAKQQAALKKAQLVSAAKRAHKSKLDALPPARQKLVAAKAARVDKAIAARARSKIKPIPIKDTVTPILDLPQDYDWRKDVF